MRDQNQDIRDITDLGAWEWLVLVVVGLVGWLLIVGCGWLVWQGVRWLAN